LIFLINYIVYNDICLNDTRRKVKLIELTLITCTQRKTIKKKEKKT